MNGTEIVPFGKHKGLPLSVMMADTQYCEWCLAQPWFTEKHKDIVEFICNGEQRDTETPAHNALQSNFLDQDFINAFASTIGYAGQLDGLCPCKSNPPSKKDEGYTDYMHAINAGWKDEQVREWYFPRAPSSLTYRCRVEEFEHKGFDVWILCEPRCDHCGKVRRDKHDRSHVRSVCVEIKPSLGDDYPATLRQIKTAMRVGSGVFDDVVLLVAEFSSKAVSIEQAKQFFGTSRIRMLMLSEVTNNARELMK